MKKPLFLIGLMVWVYASLAIGAEIKISWDANTETDLAGYNIYYGTTARIGVDPKVCTMCGYTTKKTSGTATTYIITGLTQGTTYWISVTAFDTSNNESGFSNEVNGPAKDYVAPDVPKNIRIVP